MRLFAAVTTAALLFLPAPAAAQPDAGQIMQGAIEQLLRDVPAEVRDYTMTISSGPVRSEMYVYRAEDGWKLEIPYDGSLADFFETMVVWPLLSTAWGPDGEQASAALADLRYLGLDSVEGRAAHVLATRIPGFAPEDMEIADSAHVYVDAGTRQVLRVSTSTDIKPGEGRLANGGRMEVALTLGGYETADGATLPRRMHMRLRLQVNLSDAERAEMRQELEPMLAEVAADTSEEGAEMRLMVQTYVRLVNGEPIEMSAVVEEVRVNAGPLGGRT